MARLGRPKQEIELTDAERATLERYAKRHKLTQDFARRARIILMSSQGLTAREISTRLACSPELIPKWRKRFLMDRLEALSDLPRSGRPRTIEDDRIEDCIRVTLEVEPVDATHWSTRSMAERTGMSPMAISRIWRAFGLKPHRFKTYSLSTDPDFVDKVHDVVGLYLHPPHGAMVLCVDEKSAIQALDRRQPLLPIFPGQEARGNHDYLRCGTIDLFAALDVATGAVLGKCFPRHRAVEFKKFLDHIEASIPTDRSEVHLIMDNLSTHKAPIVRDWLVKHPRYHLHFTPTHASWLNQVEIWFSLLTRKRLKRGVHRSTKELREEIERFLEKTNTKPRPFKWVRSAEQILASVARLAARVGGRAATSGDRS